MPPSLPNPASLSLCHALLLARLPLRPAAGLLGERTILAHGVYLGADERALFRDRGASVSHCPLSNCMLRSGMLNVRRLLAEGVNVSLGTDVSGGASPSMLSAIRETQKVSNLVSLVEKAERGDEWAPLTDIEAFYLATVGGAASLGVHGLVRATLLCDVGWWVGRWVGRWVDWVAWVGWVGGMGGRWVVAWMGGWHG